MSRWKFGQPGREKHSFHLDRFVRPLLDGVPKCARSIAGLVGRLSFIFRIAYFAALCALFVVRWDLRTSHAEEPHIQDRDFGVYVRAAQFCRDNAKRPMVLDLDQRVLCFDGLLLPEQNISLAKALGENGLFVVRSRGGDIGTAIALADLLLERRATVVVYDYCLSACASYLLMSSTKAVVLRDTLVAWHYTIEPFWCPALALPRDRGPIRLEKSPCSDAPAATKDGDKNRRDDNYIFYGVRTVDHLFDDPPESFTIRRILRSMFEETGRYPDVLWTWNPRYYASTLKTKIVYEAYPNSQDEVDAMASKLHLPRVIYDPQWTLEYLKIGEALSVKFCGDATRRPQADAAENLY